MRRLRRKQMNNQTTKATVVVLISVNVAFVKCHSHGTIVNYAERQSAITCREKWTGENVANVHRHHIVDLRSRRRSEVRQRAHGHRCLWLHNRFF